MAGANNSGMFLTSVGKKRGVPPLKIDNNYSNKIRRNNSNTTITHLSSSNKDSLGNMPLIAPIIQNSSTKNENINARPKSALPKVIKNNNNIDETQDTSDLSKSITTESNEFTETFPTSTVVYNKRSLHKEEDQSPPSSSKSTVSDSLPLESSGYNGTNLRPKTSRKRKLNKTEMNRKKIKEKCEKIIRDCEEQDNQEFPPVVLEEFKTRAVLAKV